MAAWIHYATLLTNLETLHIFTLCLQNWFGPCRYGCSLITKRFTTYRATKNQEG